MTLSLNLNGRKISTEIPEDISLLDFLRSQKCYSVKRGCETSNCGLCTVWLDDVPVLSCNVPAARVNGKKVTTLEGVQAQAEEFGGYLADEGGEQCGFCNPGFIMNVLAMERELGRNASDEQINAYLAGNLCRCTGYESHLRAIHRWLEREVKL